MRRWLILFEQTSGLLAGRPAAKMQALKDKDEKRETAATLSYRNKSKYLPVVFSILSCYYMTRRTDAPQDVLRSISSSLAGR